MSSDGDKAILELAEAIDDLDVAEAALSKLSKTMPTVAERDA